MEEVTIIPAAQNSESLIVVQQLPIIVEQLHSVKGQAEEMVKDALALACTEETVKVVKERRAELNRKRKELDARKLAVKKQIMAPYEEFDKVYKECITDVFAPADEQLAKKISEVEDGLKAQKEEQVVSYFNEMRQATGLDWVEYKDVGVNVTLTASLKSLKTKVKDYLTHIAADIECIYSMNDSTEVMAEYKICRHLATAINNVHQRKERIAREEEENKRRLEAQLRAQEAMEAISTSDEILQAPVEIMAEPESEAPAAQEVPGKEKIVAAQFSFMGRTFKVRGALSHLKELKTFVNDKIDEIKAYMDALNIENQEVNNNG